MTETRTDQCIICLAERIRTDAEKAVREFIFTEAAFVPPIALRECFERFGHAVAKMVLEQEPSEAMILAGATCRNDEMCSVSWKPEKCESCKEAIVEDYRAMTQQLLKELE
jgi:hypothetical protein